MNFQDELKKNLRSSEEVKREEKKQEKFPAKLENDYSMRWNLCIRVTSIVSVDNTSSSAQPCW